MSRQEYEASSPVCLHEEMHCRYGHCYDNLLIQLILIFHWWNPLVWKLKHELSGVHEYQADGSRHRCKNISIVIGEESSGFKALLYGLRFYSQFT